MKVVFFILNLLLFAAPTLASSIQISVGKGATMKMTIVNSAQNKSPKENYFHELKSCKRASKCLEFHTSSKGNKWAQVPVSIVDLTNEDDFAADLAKLNSKIKVQKVKKQDFEWGFVSSWMTQTSGSAHYFYLIPKDRTYGLRIGPIADAILMNYNLQFQSAIWKFND